MNREEAEEEILKIKEEIDGLWKKCSKIADEAGVSFYYSSPHPDSGGGRYYPPRPSDWVVIDENRGSQKTNPNKNHPEFERYHPWNDDSYNSDWTEGQWVSSSSRC